MTYGVGAPDDLIPFDRRRLSRNIFSRTVPGAAALAFGGLAGAWILYALPAAAPSVEEAPAVARAVFPPTLTPLRPARRAIAANPYGALADNPYGGLLDPRFTSGLTPAPLAQSSPLAANFVSLASARSEAIAEPEEDVPAVPQFVEGVPLPTPRPPEFAMPANRGGLRAAARQLAQQNRTSVPATAPSDDRSFFAKLFGMPEPTGPALAYAAPDGGVLGTARRLTSGPSLPYDRQTAVYDIAAHTVYLPNGTKLEAHSGLRDRLDDPRHVNERMRGATPPNVYALEPREQLFHGVKALRLNPIGSGKVYGRAGLLAHTYMLGPNGDSNGCVSFKNYDAFLRAYLNGEVKRLAVVASLD
ncbi:MAG: tlde1 domain-containing protein [Beijerinckiaceae bacterium]